MAIDKSNSGFSKMNNSHFGAAQELDSRCNESVFPAKNIRSAIRDSRDRAYVVVDSGKVRGFVVFSTKKNPSTLHIERIAADSSAIYDTLIHGVYYITLGAFGDRDCESINIACPWGNLTLRGKLIEHGFSVGPVRGDGRNKRLLFSKLMIESTWDEGTHYPFGSVVLEEILGGESRVLGVQEKEM